MTRQETAEYKTKMRSLKTKEARDAYRREHRQKMLEREDKRDGFLPN